MCQEMHALCKQVESHFHTRFTCKEHELATVTMECAELRSALLRVEIEMAEMRKRIIEDQAVQIEALKRQLESSRFNCEKKGDNSPSCRLQ